MLEKTRKKLKWLDPFTYVDKYVIPKVHSLGKNSQMAVFLATYVLLTGLVSLVLGFNASFLGILTVFYVYLFFFEKDDFVDWGIYLLSAFVFAWVIYSAFGLALGTSSPFIIVVSGSMEPLYYRGDVVILQGTPFEALQGQEVFLNQPISGEGFASFAEPNYKNNGNGFEIESIEFNSGEIIPITKEGSIIVYFSRLLQEPIIHRVVAKINASDGKFLLTKGDSENNTTIDQDCGKVSQKFVGGGIYSIPEKECIALYPIREEEVQGRALFHIPIVGCAKLWLFDNIGSLMANGSLPSDFRGIC